MRSVLMETGRRGPAEGREAFSYVAGGRQGRSTMGSVSKSSKAPAGPRGAHQPKIIPETSGTSCIG
jgi:hypothetical protein